MTATPPSTTTAGTTTAGQALEALRRFVPGAVRQVCARLQEAGHQAYTVGGCVRDALLGRIPGDWDIATSASPDEVMAVFDRTIPTGIQHGTVTVLVRPAPGEPLPAGKSHGGRIPVEVTTFRGEGAYSDGRRPDSVTFGVPLEEDLARRDFVINAMAYDPVGHALVDPFGGAGDLASRRLRAVGDARERFAEDGLRVMRAVRFAAVLAFDLDPATEAAIPGALPVLARVSRERVRDELLKLLGAGTPSRGLAIARRTGILAAILPELGPVVASGPAGDGAGEAFDPAGFALAMRRVDVDNARLVRLAALLVAVPGPLPAASDDAHPLRRLKLANAEIERVDRLVRLGALARVADLSGEVDVRRFLARLGRACIADVLALWRAEEGALRGAGSGEATAMADHAARLAGVVRAIEERGDALAIGELALSGRDIMRVCGIEPGPRIGQILAAMLARVLADPSCNTADALGVIARELAASDAS